jgi:hypothetical protein
MSDYTKATDFASKDSLPSGNAGKIVKGTEIDDEFNAIAVAVATKADENDAVLTGNPTCPTQTAGTETTRLANCSFVATAVQNGIETLHPVGSVYISIASTNPGTAFGFGTWVAFAEGQVLVGLDSTDTEFDTAEETGGEKGVATTTTGTTNLMPFITVYMWKRTA